MNQYFDMVELRSKCHQVIMPDAYTFKPRGRLGWVQSLLWQWLLKSGCLKQSHMNQIEITRHRIDAPEFMQRLYEQKRALFEFFDRDGKTLLIGSEDYANLMKCEIINQRFDFRGELWRGDAGGRTILGLKVQVIPWMTGMLVMP